MIPLYLFLTITSAGASTILMEDQRSTASTSQREDVNTLLPGFETSNEPTRQERTPDEDIIGTNAFQWNHILFFIIKITIFKFCL